MWQYLPPTSELLSPHHGCRIPHSVHLPTWWLGLVKKYSCWSEVYFTVNVTISPANFRASSPRHGCRIPRSVHLSTWWLGLVEKYSSWSEVLHGQCDNISCQLQSFYHLIMGVGFHVLFIYLPGGWVLFRNIAAGLKYFTVNVTISPANFRASITSSWV